MNHADETCRPMKNATMPSTLSSFHLYHWRDIFAFTLKFKIVLSPSYEEHIF